jgi:tetratricopeptide (TPR) repeat protein
MLIGERYRSNLVWIQVHETSQNLKEDDLRIILRDIKTHILKNRIKSGSARKFKEGKLLFYEIQGNFRLGKPSKIFCLYTKDTKVGVLVKRALKSIADRGGGYSVYSGQRFFSEMIDLVNDPKILNKKLELTEEDVVDRVDHFYEKAYDVNELGQIISFMTRADKLNWETLEKIYIHVYESIQSLMNGSIQTDPDEFLDAAYIVARGYEQIGNYPMGLELLKYITIVAAMNERYDLETSCKIRIGIIYKNYFPPEGDYIIEALSTIAEIHLLESSKPDREIYFCLMGYAHSLEGNHNTALEYYQMAIEEAGTNISSPLWIAEAYNYMGELAQNDCFYAEAARLYLTAATIAFSEGDVTVADSYRDNAAGAEIAATDIYVKSALGLRMEQNTPDAEYRAWMALRYLIKSFKHASPKSVEYFTVQSYTTLEEASLVLKIPGQARKNLATITKIKKFLSDLESQSISADRLERRLDELEKVIEENIAIPPPTFMLLTLTGQLVLMGKIDQEKWIESEIKGVILGGILVAIMSLIKEVTGQTSLRTIDAGNFKIMIERSDSGVVALLLDRDDPEFREKLQTTMRFIDRHFSTPLKNWKGKKSTFKPLKRRIARIISKPFDS